MDQKELQLEFAPAGSDGNNFTASLERCIIFRSKGCGIACLWAHPVIFSLHFICFQNHRIIFLSM
jgi:hypothetical protein